MIQRFSGNGLFTLVVADHLDFPLESIRQKKKTARVPLERERLTLKKRGGTPKKRFSAKRGDPNPWSPTIHNQNRSNASARDISLAEREGYDHKLQAIMKKV